MAERSRPSEPSMRRYVVPAFRRALIDVFGEQGRAQTIALLEGEAREELAREIPSTQDWFPIRHMISWGFAVWEGPAKREREIMTRFVRHQWDLSHGVVRRLLLHMASPQVVVSRLAKLWTEDNTGGVLEATLDDDERGASIVIRDTQWAETPHARASMAEVYRHAFSQTRARDVTETHAADGPKDLSIKLRWK